VNRYRFDADRDPNATPGFYTCWKIKKLVKTLIHSSASYLVLSFLQHFDIFWEKNKFSFKFG
jgi:hypothetical protein